MNKQNAGTFIDDDRLVYHTGLQCYVAKIEYKPQARIGILYMSFGCCDGDACVQLFRSIDPKVERIQTVVMDCGYYRPDTFYTRDKRGQWHSDQGRFVSDERLTIELSRVTNVGVTGNSRAEVITMVKDRIRQFAGKAGKSHNIPPRDRAAFLKQIHEGRAALLR